jgi:hypothetical protein
MLASIIKDRKIIVLLMSALLMLMPIVMLSPAGAEVLKGGVEEENLRLQHDSRRGQPQQPADDLRISRTPAALKGSAVDASAFAQPGTPRMAPESAPLAGTVDSNAFAKLPKGFDIGTERTSREMTLAWERWHKQLSEAIYTRWQSIARDPGKATLKITVTRDRHISAQIIDTHSDGSFIGTILTAVESLDGNPGLTFPAKSERQVVSFEADYIAGSDVTPGYNWVKNDYEHIHQEY